jgi:hypothetical protein
MSARIVIGLVVIGAVVLLTAGVAVWWLGLIPIAPPPAPPPPPAPVSGTAYNLTPAEAETIAPGTVVDRSAPAGWSHLIIKSQPRVRPSEVANVPPPPLGIGRDRVIKQVSWMFTVFTADVVKEESGPHTRYRLRAIGLGLGATVNGHETVLTVDTAAQFGVKLDFIERETLKTGYDVQKRARVVVHGPPFALVDTPVTFRCDGNNRMVSFRYAILVDAQTGQVETLCWRSAWENGGCADLTRAVLLSPNTIDEAELIPDASRFTAGVPSELGFGVDNLPPRRGEVVIPAELRDLAGKTRFTTDEARTLEDGLRKLLPK